MFYFTYTNDRIYVSIEKKSYHLPTPIQFVLFYSFLIRIINNRHEIGFNISLKFYLIYSLHLGVAEWLSNKGTEIKLLPCDTNLQNCTFRIIIHANICFICMYLRKLNYLSVHLFLLKKYDVYTVTCFTSLAFFMKN